MGKCVLRRLKSLLPSGSPTPLCEAVTKHSSLSNTSKHPQWQLKKNTIISLSLSHSFGSFRDFSERMALNIQQPRSYF